MCLFLCLCVGYAAFSTELTLTAKGNILCGGTNAKDKILADSLDSGIYADSYEADRYVYRGADVNNYITFNNQTWRIIAIESDETLKIMKDSSIGDMQFDPVGNRNTEYCSLGFALSYGCNAWAAISEFTSANGSYSGEVEEDSYLNDYLNNTYYYNLSSDARSLIVNYTYNIGGVSYSSTLTMDDQLIAEKKYQWEGKVALINLSDYIRSNSNDSDYCNTLYGSYSNDLFTYYTCRDTTWMYTSLGGSSYWWTITPEGSHTNLVWGVSSFGYVGGYGYYASNSDGVRPVIHLASGLKLSGSGTFNDPYVIEDC